MPDVKCCRGYEDLVSLCTAHYHIYHTSYTAYTARLQGTIRQQEPPRPPFYHCPPTLYLNTSSVILPTVFLQALFANYIPTTHTMKTDISSKLSTAHIQIVLNPCSPP
jgi:hypothetical protein